jgi:hypothetical protein
MLGWFEVSALHWERKLIGISRFSLAQYNSLILKAIMFVAEVLTFA